MKKKLIATASGIISALILLFISSGKIGIIDTPTNAYFKKSITKAGVAYGTCRVINASVSVVQNSTLQLEPAGVGISLAIGQVLDPIDDMTERLSDVLVTAIVSLGVQKLVYEMSIWFAPSIIAILLLILTILIWFKNQKLQVIQRNILKVIYLVIAIRMCLPVSSFINNMVNHYFFEQKIEEAHDKVNLGSKELDDFTEFSMPKVDGIMGTIENSASFLAKKAQEFKNALSTLVSNMDNMIDNLIDLTFLYVGVFFIQVIVLPVLSFWAITRLANALFDTNIPVILHHKNASTKRKIDN